MMTVPERPRKEKRSVRFPRIVLFISLSLVAAFLWSRPYREERSLQNASLTELQDRAKTAPDNPRIFYALGLRARQEGQLGQAYDAFTHAAEQDINDEKSWLASAETAEVLHGEQGAFDLLATFLKNNPGSSQAHYALALLYQKRQIHGRAYEEATEACRLNPKNADSWRLKGIEAIAWNRLSDAEVSLRQAVVLNGKDWRNSLGLGDALFELNRIPEAINFYRETVRLAPTEATGFLALGRALLPTDTTAAQTVLRQSLTLQPDIPMTHLLLGKSLALQSRWQEAKAELERAKSLSPQDSAPSFELIRVYRNLGEATKSAQESKRYASLLAFQETKKGTAQRIVAVEKEKGDSQALRLQLAHLCSKNGDRMEAAYQYRKILERNPTFTEAKTELAHLFTPAALSSPESSSSLSEKLKEADTFLFQKDYASAEKAYLQVLKKDKNSNLAAQGMGLALDAQGKPERAVIFLLHAVQNNPNLAPARFVLAKRYLEAGFPKKAGQYLQEAVKLDANNPEYWHTLGSTLFDSDVLAKRAEEAFRLAVSLSPKNALYHLDFAEILAKNRRATEAETAYRTALNLSPQNPEILSRYGGFLLNTPAQSQVQKAEPLLEKALSLDPINDFTLYGIGRLRLEQGKAKEAVKALEAALAHTRQTDVAVVWYTLSRAYGRLNDKARAEKARVQSQRLRDEYQELLKVEELVYHRPTDPTLCLRAARLYAKRRDNARALGYYGKAFALSPKNVIVEEERSKLISRLNTTGKMPNMKLFNALAFNVAL